MKRKAPILFVSWTPHARVSAVAADIEADVVIPARWARARPWPVRYLAQAISTLCIVAAQRPRVVIFTNPPFLTGAVLLTLRRLMCFSLWADCHSGAFNDPRWSRFARLNAIVLKRCNGVVFHNSAQAREYRAICRRSLVVWSWQIADRRSLNVDIARSDHAATERPTVVVPLAYAFDEPVAELLVAAKQCPDVSIVLTGAAPERAKGNAPSNVRFTGWMSDRHYRELLASADAVVCLTTRPATMQTTVIEAVEHGKPAVISDTAVLREWRGNDRTAFFVSSHAPDELSAAIRAAAAARPDRTAERLREAIIARSAEHISRLHEAVNER